MQFPQVQPLSYRNPRQLDFWNEINVFFPPGPTEQGLTQGKKLTKIYYHNMHIIKSLWKMKQKILISIFSSSWCKMPCIKSSREFPNSFLLFVTDMTLHNKTWNGMCYVIGTSLVPNRISRLCKDFEKLHFPYLVYEVSSQWFNHCKELM